MNTRSVVRTAAVCLVAFFASESIHAQPVIRSVKATNSNTQMRFDIEGGGGPFVVQRANLVADPYCNISVVSQRSNVVVSADGPHAYFLVRDLTNGHVTRLTVFLSGAAERPTPNASTAVGFGTFEVESNTLRFDIAYRGLGSGFSDAHVHLASDSLGTASPSIFLNPTYAIGTPGTSGRFAGSLTMTPAQKAAILGGKAYVNIHSSGFPGGEIRGQITPAVFHTVMRGIAERSPGPNASPALGYGVFTLIGNQLSYHIEYQGLTASATAAHIHGPAEMSGSASVLYDLIRVPPFGRSGTLAGRTNLTATQLGALVDGKSYANIHSGTFGSGEIRGQVLPFMGELPFAAQLTGFAERPNPVTTTGTGFVGARLQSNTLSFVLAYRNLPSAATAAHIHGPTQAIESAGVIVNLQPYHRGPLSTQGVFMGCVTLSAAHAEALKRGDLYMNIHTTNNPGGEIRGQLCPPVIPLLLNGAKVPGGVTTPGTAYGFAGLVGRQFSLGLHFRDLTGTVSDAHLHGPGSTNQNVGVLFGLNNSTYTNTMGVITGTTNAFVLGSQVTTDDVVMFLVDGFTYVNFHTSTFGGGEIRGHIEP